MRQNTKRRGINHRVKKNLDSRKGQNFSLLPKVFRAKLQHLINLSTKVHCVIQNTQIYYIGKAGSFQGKLSRFVLFERLKE